MKQTNPSRFPLFVQQRKPSRRNPPEETLTIFVPMVSFGTAEFFKGTNRTVRFLPYKDEVEKKASFGKNLKPLNLQALSGSLSLKPINDR